MSNKTKDTLGAYFAVLSPIIAFIIGINVNILPPSKIYPTSLGEDYSGAVSSVVTGFVFAIGWLILVMLIGVVYELTKKTPKPKASNGDME